uniref:Rieske (2Fe-2S) protein n=1 Tax=Roseivirga sp. TaxID=1964215 RepID=UPI00404823BD
MKRFKLFDTKDDLLESLDENGRLIIRIGEQKICLMRHEEQFHIFDHLCPHNKHSLFDGLINFQSEVVCPLHSYRFSHKDGVECEQRTAALKIHELRFEDPHVYLYLKD